MFEPNVELIMSRLKPSDLVLDIGGWGRPFNRANYVLDAEPYETRGYYGAGRPAQGGEREYFTRETWIQRDICDRAPFPFADKQFDFVICSHTLEDIRDPLGVCAEMARVAKAGYIEVPSRTVETCRGIEVNQVGWSHHRWLTDIGENEIRFLMKYHLIHSHWRFSFPVSFYRRLTEREQVQWLFWKDGFEFSETTIHGIGNIADELESFVQKIHPYPAARVALAKKKSGFDNLRARAAGKLRRTLSSGE